MFTPLPISELVKSEACGATGVTTETAIPNLNQFQSTLVEKHTESLKGVRTYTFSGKRKKKTTKTLYLL